MRKSIEYNFGEREDYLQYQYKDGRLGYYFGRKDGLEVWSPEGWATYRLPKTKKNKHGFDMVKKNHQGKVLELIRSDKMYMGEKSLIQKSTRLIIEGIEAEQEYVRIVGKIKETA
jgi:hypothetical protein